MRNRQYGDFQTPPELVRKIIDLLGPIGKRRHRLLEPACGSGNFIRGALESACPPDEIIGIEIQEKYIEQVKNIKALPGVALHILKRNVFDINFASDLNWSSTGPLLVVGNPPWVTNSELGAISGANLPRKNNINNLRGIEALTGKSNFDVSEFIILKLISELNDEDAAIAMLCKTAVARNVLRFCRNRSLNIAEAEIRIIDARKWFGAAVDACLFYARIGGEKRDYSARVFESLDARKQSAALGFEQDHLISDSDAYKEVSFLEGRCQIEWRQGIKHDAAAVMELELRQGEWVNGLDEIVEVESEFIYPLLKSSDLKRYSKNLPINRAVIVPQKKPGENVEALEKDAPKLLKYLFRHEEIFLSRKSRVYKNKYRFSIFGIGDYSFAKHKVIVSGFHKIPRFIVAKPFRGKPVLCDDTCYMSPFDSAAEAAAAASMLNHPLTMKFLRSVTFLDAKRPITKSVLSRIDLRSLAENLKLPSRFF